MDITVGHVPLFTTGCIAVVALALGCGGEQDGLDLISRVDSSGVELVSHREAAVREPPSYALTEALRIGAIEGDDRYEFFRVNALAQSPVPGGVFVLDRGHRAVREYGPEGRFIREFGAAGLGPGEFVSPYGIAAQEGTVLVLDRLLHSFNADGTLRAAVAPRLPGRTYLWSASWAGTKWLGERRQEPTAPSTPTAPRHTKIIVGVFDPDSGTFGEAVTTYDGAPTHSVGPAGFMLSPLFSPEPSHAVAGDGTVFVVRGGSYEIEAYDVEGRLRRVIRAAGERDPITADLIGHYIATEEERTALMPPGPEREQFREAAVELRPELPMPEFRPTLGRLFAGDNGELVVERIDLDEQPFADDDAATWDLLDPDGTIAGRFVTDARFQPLMFTSVEGLNLWGVARDDLDVQYVVRMRLGAAGTS